MAFSGFSPSLAKSPTKVSMSWGEAMESRAPVSAYAVATAPNDFLVVGTVNGGWPDTAQIAVTTAKGNGLAPAFTAALDAAIADGSYRKVLERWGLTSEAIDKSETNPPGLPKS